jgi:phospholipase C
MLARLPLVSALLSLAIAAAGCSFYRGASGSSPVDLPAAPAVGVPVSQYIKHVIVIIQENRSFENFFAGYPGANAPLYGCAKNQDAQITARFAGSSVCPKGDVEVKLHQITFDGPDLRHDWYSSLTDWDKGRMDGFYEFGNHGVDEAYARVIREQTKPYWDMAQQYVLADEMFPTEFGGSFTAHLTLVAGTDDIKLPGQAEVDFPSLAPDDCDSPPGTKSSYITDKPYRARYYFKGPFPCFNQFNTMAEVLDSAGVSWKFYATKLLDAGFWEPYEAIKYVRYGPDWHTKIIVPQTKILTDPKKGQLASVSWVTPSKADSDHPAAHSDKGPSWVASVVNAIGESSYWKTSAIVILWDDWGGWYDNSPPPQLDYRGLGIRVPCLIISPYAKEGESGEGYVSHTQYEYGSILKFIEQVFDLPRIGPGAEGYTEGRSSSIIDSFDFTQAPRRFKPIPTTYPSSRFIHEPPSDEPVDTE